MSDNETVIRNFIQAWSRLDPEELVEFFTPDGVYHNMPAQPVAGRENLRAFIAGFIGSWTSTEWDVLTLISKGDVVVAERLDRTLVGDKAVNLTGSALAALKTVTVTGSAGLTIDASGATVTAVSRLGDGLGVVGREPGQLLRFQYGHRPAFKLDQSELRPFAQLFVDALARHADDLADVALGNQNSASSS